MKTKIFNTPFENMLRVLLLLSSSKNHLSADRIIYIDFICLYGKDYGVLDYNVNGDNRFGIAEFANKTAVVKEAINQAVKNNYIHVCVTSTGLAYEINDRGRAIFEKIKDLNYSKSYIRGISVLLNKYKKTSDASLLSLVQGKVTELEVD